MSNDRGGAPAAADKEPTMPRLNDNRPAAGTVHRRAALRPWYIDPLDNIKLDKFMPDLTQFLG